MTGFIPEITTTVRVDIHSEGLDECIDIIHNDGILAECFGEVVSDLEKAKSKIEQTKDPLAKTISQKLQSHQEQIISRKHHFTGMMSNSVDITQDGDGVYLVGNTATSVDGFPYPLAIENGRREVRPVNAKYLRWWTGPYFTGDVVFAKYSNAVAPDPFVDQSINTTDGDVEELVNNFLNNVFGD